MAESMGAAGRALLAAGGLLRRAEVSADGRTLHQVGGREADTFYRDRWSHDKVVRSTHGVNCTGSCSWKVNVKDGIITWESQQTDYPSVGPDRPEYEPRGCPRGAAFSWYTYSPTRVRYPYARGVLVEMYREARARLHDPVAAWADIQGDPQRRRRYQRARGKGGLVRIGWDEALEMVAAAHVHAIKEHGPDRVAGFSPIPAMSMVSHAVGARFISLIGGSMLSFYDWYADLPVASPQVFGDQTDLPESADWWDASYLMMWGSNVPVTRTPDAHWMAEARYRGQKVVVVAPDYADNVKFADEWLPAAPGTDGALAMALMLTLSRGGPTIWISEPDAARIGVHDNDWIEAVNRNGVVVARAVVSHKMPEGTVYMYHAQELVVDVPIAEASGRRGGIHNSLTRLLVKPTHLIGGYAQLSFAFNYLGPTGNQRDEVTVIRRRSQEVTY